MRLYLRCLCTGHRGEGVQPLSHRLVDPFGKEVDVIRTIVEYLGRRCLAIRKVSMKAGRQ